MPVSRLNVRSRKLTFFRLVLIVICSPRLLKCTVISFLHGTVYLTFREVSEDSKLVASIEPDATILVF